MCIYIDIYIKTKTWIVVKFTEKSRDETKERNYNLVKCYIYLSIQSSESLIRVSGLKYGGGATMLGTPEESRTRHVSKK